MEVDERSSALSGKHLLLMVGIVLLAAGLRWYQLADWDMWTDEVQTLWTAVSGDFKEGPMYRTAPVNFWLTGVAVGLFGENELGLRFVPWLAGVATVAVFLWSVSTWFGRRVAILGALFLTLSFWHVGWSQTGRHFALQTLLVLLALHFFLSYWIGGRSWGHWASAGFLFAGLFTHSSTAFFIASFLAFLGIGWIAAMAGEAERKPGIWFKAAIPYLVAIGIYLPVFFGIGRYLVANKTAWNPPWNIMGSLLFYLPPWVLFSGLAGALVLVSRRTIHLAALLLMLNIVPALLVTASSAVTIASAAYCLACLPALAILIGLAGDWLLDKADSRAERKVALVFICGFFLSQASSLAHYYSVYNGLKPRWKNVSEFVNQRREVNEEFFAAEGDVPQFYLGRGKSRWLGQSDLYGEPATGAWYAVYMDGGVLTDAHSRAFRTLQNIGELVEVFPVFYGAKDRTLAVFHVPAAGD